MQTIYRLEDSRGLGPYRYDSPLLLKYPMLHMDAEHPSWAQANGKWVDADEYFGFRTIELLLKWFEGYLIEAIEFGFNIVEVVVYNVELCRSGKQCLFNIKDVVSKRTCTVDYYPFVN